jgi:hypothetical protein
MNVLKLAAFSHNGKGGNPAGMPCHLVVKYSPKVGESMAVSDEMRHISDD